MDKIVNLICKYVEKNIMQLTRPKTNKKIFEDFAHLANFAYENRAEETCSTWLLKETLKCKLDSSAYRGFWQTFDALVGNAFDNFVKEKVKQVIDSPSEYSFNLQEMFEHFIEQQIKELHPRTLPEEIRWFLAGAVQDHIRSTATETEYEVLLEICSGDFGQPYIEHLLRNNDDVNDFINILLK